MRGIFLSYRRTDSLNPTSRLYDLLAREIQPQFLFMDKQSIPLGTEWRNVLATRLAGSAAVIVVIGKTWVDCVDEAGGRRLDNPDDMVRFELIEAAKAGCRVIPLLLDTPDLNPEALPEPLRYVCRLQRHAATNETLEIAARLIIDALATERVIDIEALRHAVEVPIGVRAVGATRIIVPGRGREVEHSFRDLAYAPTMVVVPPGSTRLGDLEATESFSVSCPTPYAISACPVTFVEWDAAREANGTTIQPAAPFGREDQPVVNVSFDDAQGYVAWLSEVTGHRYRLPSEAEWEYAARAMRQTPFWWGDKISDAQANFNALYVSKYNLAGQFRQKTVPVRSFEPNPWGLYQVHGNIWEWCEDHWSRARPQPSFEAGYFRGGDAEYRIVRGGAWESSAATLKLGARDRNECAARSANLGFRVVRELF